MVPICFHGGIMGLMKVTGTTFRDALRRHNIALQSLQKRFEDSLVTYPGSIARTDSPLDLAGSVRQLEAKISKVQAAQTRYNLRVEVTVKGETMSLCEAVKLVGGIGRMEKVWRSASMPQVDPYGRKVRNAQEIVAIPTIAPEEALHHALEITSYGESLRDAINRGNQTSLEMEIDPSLFE